MGGRTFVDDYAWLRKKDDPKVLAYLRAENAYADAVLAPERPLADALYREMAARIPPNDESAPYRRGGYWYYQRQVEGKEHAVHCRRKGTLAAPEEVLLDLNEIAATKKFAALGSKDVSPSGRYFAYALDVTGFRQYELKIRDLTTNAEIPGRAERVTSVAFASDDKTIFYSVEDPVAKRSYRVHRHRIGTDWEKDPVVFEEKDERFEVEVSRLRSNRFIVIQTESHTTSEAHLIPADRPEQPARVVLPRKQDQEYDLDQQGERFLVRINDKGRNFRLVSMPIGKIDALAMTEVVPHRDGTMLEAVLGFRDFFVLFERAGGLPRVTVVRDKGTRSDAVAMPDAAYDIKFEGNEEYQTGAVRYLYQSLVTPPLTIDYQVATGEKTVVKRTTIDGGFDPGRYALSRFDVPVRDGTRVPVTMLAPKGAVADGRHPMVLYGYGAYGYPFSITFSPSILSMVDRGVIWVDAHVRGGGELGKPWHDAGRMGNKKHSFQDFDDVGESMIRAGWAKKDALAAWGGSAGGLLVTAATNMRPDLFRVVVAEVPFVDVLNTMMDETLPLTVGEFEEWGNPKKPDELTWMAEYSPYDNIAAKPYPAMLVRTSYNDSQVMFWEPAKYVARLRATTTGQAPIVFKTLLDPAGHGGKSGRYEKLKEKASDYAFVLRQLGVSP